MMLLLLYHSTQKDIPLRYTICLAAVFLALTFGCAARSAVLPIPTNTREIGVELEPPTDGSRSRAFVDLAKSFRPFQTLDGKQDAPTDAAGYPTTDGKAVFFDIRPVPAWNPPIDDPAAFQPNWSGTYHLSFTGQAVVTPVNSPNVAVTHQIYDPAANQTRAEIVVPEGTGLLALAFSQTRRTPTGPTNSGIIGLHLIQPGYPAGTRQIFSTAFVQSLRPFSTLRFMDWTSTNANPGYYGDPGHHAAQWADRRLPTDATQDDQGAKHGVAWEYAITLCNQTGKDIWINIPVAATDDYVKGLARLLRRTLNPSLHIYIEHSNEVWNFGFPQYIYNKLAAQDEVASGSTLNNDHSTDPEVWAHRRHAKRLLEISTIFKSVYGAAALNTTIRPVYASWLISPGPHYADVLKWVSTTYGPPKNYYYALADAAYYNAQKASPTANPDEIIAAMQADSDNNRTARIAIQTLANTYGVKHFQYEVGPDVGGGSTVNVANRILANRDPKMKALLIHDYRDNWKPLGGDLYMYFSHCSADSRYGCWGLSEDVANVHTPKWQAIYALTGTH